MRLASASCLLLVRNIDLDAAMFRFVTFLETWVHD